MDYDAFTVDNGQTAPAVSNEANVAASSAGEPNATNAPESRSATESVVEPAVATDATQATPAAQEAESAELVQIVLRRPSEVGGRMRVAGDLIGTVTLVPGVTLQCLCDAVRCGIARAR